MKREIIKRLISLVIILFGLSLMTFGLTYILPSNPAEQLAESMGAGHDREVIAKIEEKYGLDKSFGEQYVNWLKGALHGDFGMSVKYAQPVSQVLGRKLPNTVKLAVASFILMILISFPLGILSAVYKDKKADYIIRFMSFIGISLPSFWVGMMMIYIFAVVLRLLPASGRGDTVMVGNVALSIFAPGGIRYVILPAITLALTNVATMLRLTRSGILENMRQDYIKFARAKGVPAKSILFGHALKNALIPVVTIFGMDLGNMIAFTTITETIFAWPGMGKLLIDAINKSDRPIIVAYLMAAACMFVVLNFIVDILYTLIDPRIELR